jgi:hypothetical protein
MTIDMSSSKKRVTKKPALKDLGKPSQQQAQSSDDCKHPALPRSTYYGDSFDLVKRFFIAELNSVGFDVRIEPMLTGEWNGQEQEFYQLIGCSPAPWSSQGKGKKALLFDPDKGVNEKGGRQHASFRSLIDATKSVDLVLLPAT